MPIRYLRRLMPIVVFVLSGSSLISTLEAQGAKQEVPGSSIGERDADHVKERNEWFLRGRVVAGRSAAELRRRAYLAKLRMLDARAAAGKPNGTLAPAAPWQPLGPVPLASDATGNGTQDYHQVAGRATTVVIDPADASGNTIYVGGAQGGVWKSTNATVIPASDVTWIPLTDAAVTLSIGAMAIQPGNTDVTKSVILAATGEADNSANSYFGLGILRSADGGNTWSLASTANNGALSFSGLGGTRMAFGTAQPNTVVAAMATTSEGLVAGAVSGDTTRGLYTSLDAGQTWTYDALSDPGGATDATSATSVVYNPGAALFFAAVRYHGFYSSPDGVNWTRLANQPSGSVLSTTACPPQSTSNNYACPIYRAEITAVPGRNEMYAWFISLDANNNPVDQFIWQSLNGGGTWTQIADTSIANCGDFDGCGVAQGTYNLALLAVPNCPVGQLTCGTNPTDIYAGAINLYKCSLPMTNTTSPACSSGFLNLTHVYGCDPIGAPAHVHPDQHALAYILPTTGTDSGNDLMYFANDGGLYRALDGYGGLTSGSCSIANSFDDLNQNLGSMTQFVSFSEHPTDPNTLLGGTQDNGSPATNEATTSLAWGNVLGGDGGYDAIDPDTPANFYASNPDIPPGGLGIQLCPDGVNCVDGSFNFVVTSSTVGGDDGDFYFPYMLDPQSATAMLVGTCRVWRGPRAGGSFTVLSPNFDTLGSGTCSGNEVNLVRALAAGGSTDANGSTVIYATTSGLGPLNGPTESPAGGQVWVTTNATEGSASFADVTNNGPQGSINPNQFPISGVAIDASDATGGTAYATVMGFTAAPGSASGPGHVWKTTNSGGAWIDFTGNLPDSPANAVVVDSVHRQVYVGTDVGVFVSPTSAANWSEVGPVPGPGQTGFLPNVAVTALGVFNSGGQEWLRASTYGRGIWQFNLQMAPDFDLGISNSPQSVTLGQNATFDGTATGLNGYSSSVTLTCVAGATVPPTVCTPSPSAVTPGVNTPFTITASGVAGDYYFNVQGTGSDANHVTHQAAAVLHISTGSPDFTLSEPSAFPTVNAGSTTTSGPVAVTATNGFAGVITLACALVSGNGSCASSPATVGSLPATVNLTVNATNLSVGSYQLAVQGTSGSITHTLVIPFSVGDYQLSGPSSLTVGIGAQGTESLTIVASTYYSGRINASCDASALPGASCSLAPANPVIVNQGATVPFAATITVPASATPGSYDINIRTQDTTGAPAHTFSFSLIVAQNFAISAPSPNSQTVGPGLTTGAYNFAIGPAGTGGSFNSAVTLACSGLPAGAQCAFSPSTPITPGSSAQPVAMTIATSTATPAGTYPVVVTGTSSSLTHSVTVALVVTGDFQLVVTQPFAAFVETGAQARAQVSVTPNYSGSVVANCDASAVAGAQCTVVPVNPISISANTSVTLTIIVNLPANASAGQYNIKLAVTDASGQPNHVAQVPLAIEDFSLALTPPSQSVIPGQTSGAYQLTIAPNPSGSSFAGAVSVSCSGLPTGAQCAFNPATAVTPGSNPQAVAMTISTTASGTGATPTGTYTVTVAATSGSLSHSQTATLVVANSTTPPDFQLAVTQAFPANVDAGTSQTAKVSVTANYSGLLDASCDSSSIAGSTCAVSPGNPIAVSANSAAKLTISLTLTNNSPIGQHTVNLTVTDSSGQPSHSLQLPLTVIQDFSVNCAQPCSQTVTAGQTTGAYQISVAPNPAGSSFTAAVALACTSGLPSGAKCLFNPSTPVTPDSSSQAVVLSISTVTANAALKPARNRGMLFAWWLPLPGIVVLWCKGRSSGKGRCSRPIRIVGALLLLLFLPSCSGISQGGGGSTQSVPVTYTITVTGTSSGAPADAGQATQVTLVVN